MADVSPSMAVEPSSTPPAPQPTAPAASQSTAAAPAAQAPADRPRPLHDPDPYSTPPYGEPGPWAPAPPVQHPMATPAQGTPVYGTPGHGTPIPSTPTQGTPAHGAPPAAPVHSTPPGGGTPHPGTPAPGTHTQAMPAPTASAHTPPPHDAVPPHGNPAHAGAHGVPAQPNPGTGTPAAAGPPPSHMHGTPAPGGPAPAHPHGTPAPGAPTSAHPHGTPAPSGATSAHPHGTPAPSAPTPTHPHSTPTPSGTPTPVTPTTPWQRYDPWSAPLQQTGAAVETQRERRRRGRQFVVLGAVVIALVAGGIGGVVGAYLEREGGIGSDIELPQAGSESEKRPKDSVAGIAASALPGVVTLHVRGDDGAGTGTGFVLDGKGHILTNNHVVEPAGTGGEITVTFSGGETASAKVIGRDAGYDLAVVKVSGVRGLKPLPLGNSENVQVGDPVVAIGAPFDLANTVTSGIISAKERPITAGGEKGDGSDVSYVNALQTDAPINPGNSGGPLVDAKARVIGINSAIRSADSGSAPEGGQSGSIGLGFAIPINQGKRVAEELINTGRATHPVIGVTIDKQFTGDGARIARKSQSGGPAVNRGGPGAKAGLKPGDVITAVDGQRVHSGDELIVKVRAHRPKDRLELTVERDGDERKVTLVLGTASGQ
ncbi:trypsin-like peptidase domain-containing protein [Streptomyces lasiicapitis]|uniref:S1C family serine protease n=1 Tax=Streptomyces lasiicapitis TaxID=1923961 RepID=UPI0036665645